MMRRQLIPIAVFIMAMGCGDGSEEAKPVDPIDPVDSQDEQIPATQIVFEDPDLEMTVRASLDQPDGTLTEEDLASLMQLGAPGSSIQVLAGIEGLKNLQFLDLWPYGRPLIFKMRQMPML